MQTCAKELDSNEPSYWAFQNGNFSYTNRTKLKIVNKSKNKWFLVYTLLNNIQLAQYRKSNKYSRLKGDI